VRPQHAARPGLGLLAVLHDQLPVDQHLVHAGGFLAGLQVPRSCTSWGSNTTTSAAAPGDSVPRSNMRSRAATPPLILKIAVGRSKSPSSRTRRPSMRALAPKLRGWGWRVPWSNAIAEPSEPISAWWQRRKVRMSPSVR
jgi:hypothetical protein